ncbi:MAG TPA: GNAT family N-acetyltransferase [Candidatus Limnocylindrales bacterium]|nr:GNAT family N-acetyltransferase [Candidatus Limnocylindrales bacterium]
MATVTLREISTETDWDSVMGLRLGPGQDRYVNPIDDIRLEAAEEARAMPRPWAIHDGESGQLVGFVMISDNIPEPMDDDLVGPYYLWKLLIDVGRQRRGYGRATLDAVVDYVRGRPDAETLFTSAAPGDASPYPYYLAYGFEDTGRVMWGENVLALRLG